MAIACQKKAIWFLTWFEIDKNMKITVCILSLGLFCGCANLHSAEKNESFRVQAELNQKESRIRELEALLAQREAQIQEKDSQIQQLKDKLRGLGVF
jgi:septal ring factor EnvC (AmiA/AmiB activator)